MHLHRFGIAVCFALALAGCGGTKGPPQWEACRSSAEAKARVQADIDQGITFGVTATPTLAVNGTAYAGPAPSAIEGIVASAITAAQADAAAKKLDASVYYDQAIVGNPTLDMPVPVGDAPASGPSSAWVTIVEFSDFECPYCRNAEPAIQAVLAAYPNDVRLVYKEFPLPFHDQAMPAALAADCAGQQGKFWGMHDLLMKGSLDDGALVGYADQLGLK